MIKSLFSINFNEQIADCVYKMEISGDTSPVTAPGQFINILIDDCYLRRPISICDWDKNILTIIYKTVGKGTLKMSRMTDGQLDILLSLGNGYDMTKSGTNPVLIGGGVGVPPLYGLCKRLILENKKPYVVLGFNSAQDVFYEKEFKDLGAETIVTTKDGSYGKKGFVTDALIDIPYTYFYTCGPEAMFKSIEKIIKTSGQYSFEERMGCGFGACMGCSCKTKYGNKRICKDGPVLEREEIIW